MSLSKEEGINVLSLFDGMSCGQIALQKAGIKVNKFFASEIDEHAIKVTQHNFPNTIQLGDVTKINAENLPHIDLLIGGSPCFTAGNLVMTNNGYIPIEDIKVGDLVLTHKNRYRKVLRIGGEKKQTLIIKSQGSTMIETTKNHPFYCFEDKKEESQFVWKNIVDFKNTDKVVSINWGVNVDSKEFSDIDLYILGRFLADGCCYRTKRKNRKDSYQYKFKISIGKHELEIFKSKVDDRFSYIEDKTVYNAIIYRKEWVEIGDKFGHLAHNKFIPNFILDLPVERLKIFLNGYMDGDGHIRKGNTSKVNTYKRNTTVSEKLALTLSLAVQKCYNGVSICYTRRNKKHTIEGRVVNQKDTYEVSFTENKTKFSKYKVIDDYTVYNLTKSTSFKEGGINNVYNIEVEEDNSYIVNNLIVHNCQGFSFAGKQLNFEDPRSKLFFEFVRLKNELNPAHFLLENVRMKKEYRDVISEYLGVQPIEINSSNFVAQNRPRLYWSNFKIEKPKEQSYQLKNFLLDDNDESIEKFKLSEKAIDYMNRLRNGKPRWNYHTNPLNGNAACLTANMYKGIPYGVIKEKLRKLTPVECERLQGVPDNYTNVVSNTQRLRMLGNGWTVNVIEYIFSQI